MKQHSKVAVLLNYYDRKDYPSRHPTLSRQARLKPKSHLLEQVLTKHQNNAQHNNMAQRAREAQLQRIKRQAKMSKQHRAETLDVLRQRSKLLVNRGSEEGMWVSPFVKAQRYVSFDEQGKLPSTSPSSVQLHEPGTQIRYQNLHRMFKGEKDGLQFIHPLQNAPKGVSQKTALPILTRQYNRLLKISQMPRQRLVLKGQPVTLQNQFLYRKRSSSVGTLSKHAQSLQPWVVAEYCPYFKEYLRSEEHLLGRFVEGLCQEGALDLKAYLRYHRIFVKKQADSQQLTSFLSYFFIPKQFTRVQLSSFSLLLQLLCQVRDEPELPDTLLKTLLGGFMDRLKEVGCLSRQILQYLLEENHEVAHVMVALFYRKQP